MCPFHPSPMPQNHFLIATKTISAEVYVFDYSKHPSKPAAGARECRCLCRHRLCLGELTICG